MARITEALTPLLISINVRHKTHAGIKITGLLTGAPVVVLAGGTGGAKLARGMLDVAGDDLVVIANTADDVEIYGAYVSPRPRPRARSGWPTASTSAAGACATTRST